jgi:MarR family transcriptional regulator, organic hydroperoxide resistance regulator
MKTLTARPPNLASSPGRQVRRADIRLNRALRNAIAEYGIGIGEFQLLRALYHVDGATQSEVSTEIEVEHGALTKLFQSMEENGYIRRERDALDSRKRNVFLTARGQNLRAPILSVTKSINIAACRGIAPDDVATALRVLDQIAENLDAMAAAEK